MEIEEILRLNSAPLSPAEDDCYYNLTDEKYYIYTNGAWVETTTDTTSTNFYAIKYKKVGDIDYIRDEKTDMGAMSNFIKTLGNLEEVYVYYGSITQPANLLRIRAKKNNTETEDFATIEKCTFDDGIYKWKVLKKISPRIFLNKNLAENVYFNNTLITDFFINN